MIHNSPFVSVDLKLKRKEDVHFPFFDYGFLYGYGLFETIPIRNGKPLLWREHLERLTYSANILEIPFEYQEEDVTQALEELIKQNDVQNAVLNVYLTPGNRPVESTKWEFNHPFFMMVIRPYPKIKAEIELGICEESFQRIRLDQFKTLSFVKNIMEKRLNARFDDVLLYNHDKVVLETPVANAFFVQGNTIVTPKSQMIMPGIVRRFLLKNKDLDIKVSESAISVDDLENFDEIFLTNSLRGIILVHKTTPYPHLVSGPVARQIKVRYNELLGITDPA